MQNSGDNKQLIQSSMCQLLPEGNCLVSTWKRFQFACIKNKANQQLLSKHMYYLEQLERKKEERKEERRRAHTPTSPQTRCFCPAASTHCPKRRRQQRGQGETQTYTPGRLQTWLGNCQGESVANLSPGKTLANPFFIASARGA